MKIKQPTRHKRSGFTLMELLLVMAILVVMASMATFAFLRMQGNALEDAARSQISSLKSFCTAYKLDVGRYPSKLNDLLTQPSGLPEGKWRGPYMEPDKVSASTGIVDPWGTPYNYTPNDTTDRLVITSNGADGQANTEDDVPRPREAGN